MELQAYVPNINERTKQNTTQFEVSTYLAGSGKNKDGKLNATIRDCFELHRQELHSLFILILFVSFALSFHGSNSVINFLSRMNTVVIFDLIKKMRWFCIIWMVFFIYEWNTMYYEPQQYNSVHFFIYRMFVKKIICGVRCCCLVIPLH